MRVVTWRIVVVATVLLGLSAAAQGPGGTPKTRTAPTIGAATGKVLNDAIELLNGQDFDGAAEKIATLSLAKLGPYERSKVEQILFNISYAQGRYDEACAHLHKAIDAGGLDPQEIEQARFQCAQLYLQQEKWQDGVTALERWFATAENPNAAAYYLWAVAYYQKGDFDRALAPARRAVELGDPPQESWVALLVALHLKRQEFPDAARLLQQLVVRVPDKRSYWVQLSAVYGQMQDYESSLAVMQVAYDAGLLSEDADIRRFADLLLFNGLPYRGAQVLEGAIESGTVTLDQKLYEKLASCWIAARELDRAVEPLQRAGELSSSGEPFLRLGEVEVQREDWVAAEGALHDAVAKGGLRDGGNAGFLLGVALFNQGRLAEARTWFLEARRSPPHRESADEYLNVIASRLEQTRL